MSLMFFKFLEKGDRVRLPWQASGGRGGWFGTVTGRHVLMTMDEDIGNEKFVEVKLDQPTDDGGHMMGLLHHDRHFLPMCFRRNDFERAFRNCDKYARLLGRPKLAKPVHLDMSMEHIALAGELSDEVRSLLKNVTDLDLSYNLFNKFEEVITIGSWFPSLKILRIGGNRFDGEGVDDFIKAFKHLKCVDVAAQPPTLAACPNLSDRPNYTFK